VSKEKIHVVGGGLVGTLTALYLGKEGFEVELYERRPDMRRTDISAGRSINLVITDRGLRAVDRVGLKEKILEITIPMKGRMLHDIHGETTYVPYGQNENEVINSISRGELNKLLLDAAEAHPKINVHFEHRCTDYDFETSTIFFDNGKKVEARVTLGTDGAFSALRRSMLDHVKNFNYSQSFLEHGYKELTIPATAAGQYAMEKNYLHIWPRANYMLIALPNLDGSFTCTLFYPYEGEESFEQVKTEQDVRDLFQRVFPDAVPIMPTLVEDYMENPVGPLVTIRCAPWNVGGELTLLGDAAHAIVPFFGQGMNSGFEDCRVLGDLINEHNRGSETDWETVFSEFSKRRVPNAEAIADLALENFVEMRDSTADPFFQLKKSVGFELEKRHPDLFVPRYSMVMFHPDIPYAEARHKSVLQDRMLNELCGGLETPEQVDWERAERMLQELVNSEEFSRVH